uniref:Nodule-specific cysteine-rich peptide G02 n=1 Tax=Pisum sativum TaxID=3888 RepID=A0A7T8DV45_PEA|nr:nodule-specific cysteine-rich peptide G02 [Pisum sativum]
MVKTIKFVYALILFLFIIFIAKNVDALQDCKVDADCPQNSWTRIYRCIENKCRYTRVMKYNE